MADAESVQSEEVVEQSTPEPEEVSTDDGVELEDMEVSFDDLPDDESEESESADEETDEPEEVEEESTESEDAPVEESQADDTPAEPVKTPSDYAKERIAQREAKRLADEQAQQAYLNEVQGDDTEAQRRQNIVDQYNRREERIQLNEDKIEVGIDKAIASIELFRHPDPEVKEELAKSLDEYERLYVTKDENGRYLEVRKDVFTHLQEKADSIRRSIAVGERLAKQNDVKTKARTTITPSRTPKQEKSDPDLDAFDAVIAGM